MSKQAQPIWVPPSSSQTVVFPLNDQSNAFYTEFYDPQMTNDKVSLQEINQFISHIDKQHKLYKKNKEEENSKQDCFAFLFVFTVILDFCLVASHSRDGYLGIFTKGEMIIFTWFFLVFAERFCYCIYSSGSKTDFLSQMKDKCQDMLDKENGRLRSRNLKWHLPDEFPAWIELTKDMQKQNNLLETPKEYTSLLQKTENLIIFPLQYYKTHWASNKLWRFSYDFFSPEMTADRISYKEVLEFFSKVNAFLRADKGNSHTNFIGFLLLTLPLFGLLYISNHFPDLLTASQIKIGVVLSVSVAILLWFYKFKKEEKERYAHMRIGFQEIIDKHNETLQERGLKWQLPDKLPIWIELCKNAHESVQLLEISPKKHSSSPKVSPQDDAEAQMLNDAKDNHKKVKPDMYAPLLEENSSLKFI